MEQVLMESLMGGLTQEDAELLKEARSRKAKQERNARRRKEREAKLEKSQTVLPNGEQKYSVILADPPWRYNPTPGGLRDVENHYPTMSATEIKNLPVKSICHENAVLYLWTTTTMLPLGCEVMKSWGFTYKSSAIWVKDVIGMGYWFRCRHELLLVGTKGQFSPPEVELRRDSIFEARRTEHSKKPEIIMEYLDSVYPNHAKIELFCRSPRHGWDAWGNEV